jgi:N-acetylglucosamine-6-phosphate deacetylase
VKRLGVRAALVAGRWVDGDVGIEDGRVAAVGLDGSRSDLVAAPGFVDRQVNGFAGVDLRDADADGYSTVASRLAEHGAIAFCPTFHSTTPARYLAALERLAEVHAAPPSGARVLGAHLEGPFLSRRWSGAHDPDRFLDPDLDLARSLLAAGPVSIMTIAPELVGANEVIGFVTTSGAIVSMGHTDVDAAGAHEAIAAGVSMITHCYNAHRRFAPRDPGPAGVALVRPEVSVGLICDLVHLAAETVLGVFAAAGERVVVVTDAVAPAGSETSTWRSDHETVTIVDGRATLADGTLAGSVVTPDASLRALLSIGVEPAVALAAMATNPARGFGLGPHDMAPECRADLVVLDDGWQVHSTLVGGEEVAKPAG